MISYLRVSTTSNQSSARVVFAVAHVLRHLGSATMTFLVRRLLMELLDMDITLAEAARS